MAAVVASSPEHAERARVALPSLARVNCSCPPHHGPATVSRILGAQKLKVERENELEQMRQRFGGNRSQLAALLGARVGSQRFDFVGEHAVYMPDDG
ncbi:aminotransferase class I/II-fold pyridoxal phosphate-dependent enzyme [Paraburkholderia terrae]|uniref:aminotransferase class I/II-fold pyridoxal phosphate-dependent enzyme n=1 Tax=Paraburkholderia terrae TaxID=311230 RepID=UPI0033654ADF